MKYECTLFGLDEAGRVLASEEIEVVDVGHARQWAHDRLKDYPRVELWQSFICVERLARPVQPRV